jgi:small membrane protein
MFVVISQIFSVLLAVVAISKSYVDFRGRRESLQMFVLWCATWIAIVSVALFPAVIPRLIAWGGGQAGIGTFLGMALVFLFFLLYRVYVKLERLEHRIAKLVQEAALGEYKKIAK